MAQSFQNYVANERKRLTIERASLTKQRRDLETKLAGIERELEGIKAYEAAKGGKPSQARGRAGAAPKTARATTGTRSPRGSKRNAIMAVLTDVPHGLSRGEILEKMGMKGNKSGEMSVSNALTALTKGNQLVRKDGRYIASMG